MTTMDDTEVIRSVTGGFGGEMVHVGAPNAYEAFSRGMKLFDIAPGGAGLQCFMKQNHAEFGSDFKLSADGSLESLSAYQRTIYILSRKRQTGSYFYRNDTWR